MIGQPGEYHLFGLSRWHFEYNKLIDSEGNIDYNRISLFSTADYGFTSYARKLPVPGFQYGVNAKIIRRVIGKFADSDLDLT
jgi:hypothetical protein